MTQVFWRDQMKKLITILIMTFSLTACKGPECDVACKGHQCSCDYKEDAVQPPQDATPTELPWDIRRNA